MRKGCFVRIRNDSHFLIKSLIDPDLLQNHALVTRSNSSLAGSTQSCTRLLSHWRADEKETTELSGFLGTHTFTGRPSERLDPGQTEGLLSTHSLCCKHVQAPWFHRRRLGEKQRRMNFVTQKKPPRVRHNITKGMKMDTEKAYSLWYGGRGQGKRDRNLSVSW